MYVELLIIDSHHELYSDLDTLMFTDGNKSFVIPTRKTTFVIQNVLNRTVDNQRNFTLDLLVEVIIYCKKKG